MEEEHEKKKNKWKTFYHLQKELLKKKIKSNKVSLFEKSAKKAPKFDMNMYGCAAPPEEIKKLMLSNLLSFEEDDSDECNFDLEDEVELIVTDYSSKWIKIP